MNKTNRIIMAAGISAGLVIILALVAFGHGMNSLSRIGNDGRPDSWAGMGMMARMMHGFGNQTAESMKIHHESMEKIIETGTYADLEQYREESGINLMPMVQNQDDFEVHQKMHQQMEQWHEENISNNINSDPKSRRGMMGKGFAQNGKAGFGCPMMNND